MTEVEALAFKVLEQVSLHGPIQLEKLGVLLPACTWNQMFAAVDWLSREGRLEIQHPDRCTYEVRLRAYSQGNGECPLRQSGLPS
ncbi:MAG: hypothetical protein HY038_00405 [Nitrospirae bacterium]|nr:hypothetical protein [Nitrospirota bacterium]